MYLPFLINHPMPIITWRVTYLDNYHRYLKLITSSAEPRTNYFLESCSALYRTSILSGSFDAFWPTDSWPFPSVPSQTFMGKYSHTSFTSLRLLTNSVPSQTFMDILTPFFVSLPFLLKLPWTDIHSFHSLPFRSTQILRDILTPSFVSLPFLHEPSRTDTLTEHSLPFRFSQTFTHKLYE